MRVFGYTRFSFLGKSDVLAQRDVSKEELHQQLYNDERMNARFHLFENICLPSIASQTNKHFRVFIAATASMPQIYKDRLDGLVENMPEIEVLYSDATNVSEVFNTKMEQMVAGATRNCVHFRLDDDDAISCRVVQKLYDYADFTKDHGVIHFPNGIYLHGSGDKAVMMREYAPHTAIGFAFVNPPDLIKNPYQCGHVQYPKKVPNVAVSDICGFVHAAHSANDTNFQQTRVYNRILAADPNHSTPRNMRDMEASLKRDFPQFTVDGLKRAICGA